MFFWFIQDLFWAKSTHRIKPNKLCCSTLLVQFKLAILGLVLYNFFAPLFPYESSIYCKRYFDPCCNATSIGGEYQSSDFVPKYARRGATIAQWIRLRLSSCHLGSSPKHTIYAFFNLYCSNCIFVIWIAMWTKINKKRPGLALFKSMLVAWQGILLYLFIYHYASFLYFVTVNSL